MSSQESSSRVEPSQPGESGRHRRRWIIATVVSVFVAGATAFAAGLGSDLADSVNSSSPPLLSYSDEEVEAGCGPGVFLPALSMKAELKKRPQITDWREVQKLPGAAFVGTSTVEVSIQGESERPVTLTGIDFNVARQPRPKGAIVGNQCGGPRPARAIKADLDVVPPQVVESNSNPQAFLGEGAGGLGQSRTIQFPWTVTLTDPLLLLVMATTESQCYCTWSAEIPWVSGNERGTLKVDNDGDGYRLVSEHGLPMYLPIFDHWEYFPPSS